LPRGRKVACLTTTTDDQPFESLPVALLLLLTVLTTAASAPFDTALAALVPRLAGKDQLTAANSARAGVTEVSSVLGPPGVRDRIRRPARCGPLPMPLVRTALLCTAVPLLLLGVLADRLTILVAVIMAAILGGANVVAEIQCDSVLQTQLDDEVLGRAFGLVLPACMLAVVAGTAGAQVLADALSLPGAFVLLGVLVLVYVPIATFRQPAESQPAPAGEQV
jgi:hypothetical protein